LAGLKSVCRGNKFNQLVREKIEMFILDSNRFEIVFEQKCPIYDTSEIPDWYIYDKTNDKLLIGMNQLDLWNGGHQYNRGSKYVLLNTYPQNRKLLCVIANKVSIKSKNKAYKILERGFKTKTVCYLTKLHQIIHEYFNI